MKNKFKILVIGFCLVLSAPLSADDDHEEARRLVESGKILELEEVLKKARKIKAGKVLEVELESKRGKMIYEIELLYP